MRSALLVLVLIATSAQADPPRRALWVGAHVGGNIVTDDWDLATVGNIQIGPSSGALVGLRVGGQIIEWFALEAGVNFIPYTANNDESGFAISLTAEAMAPFYQHDWQLFGVVGTGVYTNADGGAGSDSDVQIRYGLMLRGMLTGRLALRVDARHVITDGYEPDSFLGNNVELTAGIDYHIISQLPDGDGDGIVDRDDACPDVSGHSSARGCPDGDGDSVVDGKDSCPKTAGLVDLDGCPDGDGDGVTDKDDACPKLKGVKALAGCPDGDGDGLPDKDDQCPEVAGPKTMQGCPDKDGDGLTDAKDACPDKAGPIQTKGCPDGDGDGVADKDDKCPEEHGLAELQGCMPQEVAEKFSGTLEGIYFGSGSAKILDKSFPVLDEASRLLEKYPTVRIRIEGHTDDRGNDAKNLKLSKDRASSVKAYLVTKGIDANRLVSDGLGETKPIADNKKKKGRAKNRRIEFRVIQD